MPATRGHQPAPADSGSLAPSEAPLLGRQAEFSAAVAALSSVARGNPAVILISGDAGIGKTYLAEMTVAHARSIGFRAIWGRSSEGAPAPAYWPWIQIFRHLDRPPTHPPTGAEPTFGPTDLQDVLAPHLDISSTLHLPHTDDLLPRHARFRLFDNLTNFLASAATQQCLLIVLDDLHRADPPSLHFLHFLANAPIPASLAVVATYRDQEVPSAHPLLPCLTALKTLPQCHHLQLTPLNEQATFRLIENDAGFRPSPSWLALIYAQSEGNPFFTKEITRLLLRDGSFNRSPSNLAPLAPPPSVRDVISRRLGQLSRPCHALLGSASVIGNTFHLSSLRSITRFNNIRLVSLLEEALQAHLIIRSHHLLGEYSFAHNLIGTVFYTSLSPLRRMRLHKAIGRLLDTQHAAVGISCLPQLAHHFYHAGPLVDTRDTLLWCTKAAEHATKVLAYEDAVQYYQRALDAAELTNEPHLSQTRCDLLLSLGEAQNLAGELLAGRETFLRAADIARDLRLPRHYAQAALGYGWEIRTGFVDERLVSLLKNALKLTSHRELELRIHLKSRLSRALYWAPNRAAALKLSRDALSCAETLGDVNTSATALATRYVALWSPDHLAERSELTQQLRHILAHVADPTVQAFVIRFTLMDLLERTSVTELQHHIDNYNELAVNSRLPFLIAESYLFRGMRAIVDGHLNEASEHLTQATAFAKRLQSQMLLQSCWAQTVALERLVHSDATLPHLVGDLASAFPALPVWQVALVVLLLQRRREDGRRALQRFMRAPLSAIPRDGNYIVTLTLLSEACFELSLRDEAQAVYNLLEQFSDRNVVVGYAAVCDGSVSHYLGLLAFTLGNLNRAEEHFVFALHRNAALGAPLLNARTKLRLAEMLYSRSGAGDRVRAQVLIAEATSVFHRSGMRLWHKKARTLMKRMISGPSRAVTSKARVILQSESPAASEVSPTSARSEPHLDNIALREGDYWTVVFDGSRTFLHTCRGLEQMMHLVRNAEREIPAILLASIPKRASPHLAGPHLTPVPQPPHLDHWLLVADAGPASDRRARLEYAKRIKFLLEQIVEAEASNDSLAATQLRTELAHLREHLKRSVFFNGHPRGTGSPLERARITVRVNITNALNKIKLVNPDLSRHFHQSIRTGRLCSYSAPSPIRCI